MRIVGGDWRGRTIETPSGKDTRPTTDRNREALASMVLSACNLDLDGMKVLDAFCGSGAVALELLSRGAAYATLVERSRKTAAVAAHNIESLHAQEYCSLVVGDIFVLAGRGAIPGGPFHIVFLDPPYAFAAQDVESLVDSLADKGLLAEDCLIIYERDADSASIAPKDARIISQKSHGLTAFDLFRLGEAD